VSTPCFCLLDAVEPSPLIKFTHGLEAVGVLFLGQMSQFPDGSPVPLRLDVFFFNSLGELR
jgi:hypothetical protein